MNAEEIKQEIQDYKVQKAKLEAENDFNNNIIKSIYKKRSDKEGNLILEAITKEEINFIKELELKIETNKGLIKDYEKSILELLSKLPKLPSINTSMYFVLYYDFILYIYK